jgi:hypothetical protein
MKTYLIILIAICTLFSKVYAQSSSAAIDTLIKYKVITSKDLPIIKDEFKYKYNDASDEVVVLRGLEKVMLQREFHINPHKMGFFSFDYGKPNPKEQDSVNLSLHELLQKINIAGLLTNSIYRFTLKEIDSGRYMGQVQLLSHLAEMSSRLEWMSPARLLPVVDTLHNDGVISDTSFSRLKNDIRDGKIESSFQLNSYFKFDQTFDLTKYPKDSLVWLEPFLLKVASILPNLKFSNFGYSIEPDTTFGLKIKGDTWIKIKVKITCNGQDYKYAVLANQVTDRLGKIHLIGITYGYLYRIFNKILVDQQSQLRLHNISFSHAGKEEDHLNYFAFIALKDEQFVTLMKTPCSAYMLVSLESSNDTLTSAKIDNAIAEWQKIGLFAHLTQAEINKGIDDAETADWLSMNTPLENFPHVVCQLNKSFEVPRHHYTDFLIRLAAITHGAFNPTKITEHKIKGGVKLQYMAEELLHYAVLDNEPWIDLKTSEFLKTLGRENDLPGDFYVLPGRYEVIYLTKQQCAYAIAHKLLDFDTTSPGRFSYKH